MKDAVRVSHEMTTLVGTGHVPNAPMPANAALFVFSRFGDGAPPVLSYRDRCDLAGVEDAPLIFVVAHGACQRIFGAQSREPQSWHLPSALRTLALSIIECETRDEARTTLRLARSIELLCQVHAALADGTLIPVEREGVLSETDVARIASVRGVIDQRWQEKLTIAQLASIAGINRDKLVRGFRDLYGATIAEVLTERRLGEARRLLLATDLPVASVAYRCSYLNNASFTRAFARRYGVAPTELRRLGIAA